MGKNKIDTSNLGEGSVLKLFFALAIPTIISQVVNMLYNIVDRMYIGHIPETGVMALTGLGLCFPIIMLIGAFSSLFGMGGAPKAAIEMGKGKIEEGNKILGNCVSSLVLIALVLTVTVSIFGKELLYLFGASDATIPYAWSYMRIYAVGTLFVQITLGLNNFITTQGFTKYSMLTVLIGAVLNIILDPIFIFVLNMGVSGAAVATIISQSVSCVWVILFLTGKKSKLKISRKHLKIKKEILLPIMALGTAPFIMQSTESLLNISFNMSLSKYGGDIAVGTMTLLSSIFTVCFLPMQGLAQGAQPIISFNYGARKIDRVIQAMKIQTIICTVTMIVIWVISILYPEMFIYIFSDDPEIVEYTKWAMKIYMAGMVVFGVQISCQQIFLALGQAKISIFCACFRKLVLLIPLIFILPHFFEDKVFAVFLAEPIVDITAAIVTMILFAVNIKKILYGKEEKALK